MSLALTIGRVLRRFGNNRFVMKYVHGKIFHNRIGKHVRFHGLAKISESEIGDFSYVSGTATIQRTKIGKFCSIGPNFISGWGRHPVEGISTSPMFYSTGRQNGVSLVKTDQFEEKLPVNIGNDVFIGANVMLMDGVKIADGAVVGAGAVVTKDVPPYAIVGGVPAKVLRYRFTQERIDALLRIEWWNFPEKRLEEIAEHFFAPDWLIHRYDKNQAESPDLSE